MGINFNNYYPIKLEIVSNFIREFSYFEYRVSRFEFKSLILKSKKGISKEELYKLLINSSNFDIEKKDIEEIIILENENIGEDILRVFYYILLSIYEKEDSTIGDKSEKLKEKFYTILTNKIRFSREKMNKFEKNFFEFLVNYRNSNKRFETYLYEQMILFLEGKDYTLYDFCKYQNIRSDSIVLKKLVYEYVKKNKMRLKKEVIEKIKEVIY